MSLLYSPFVVNERTEVKLIEGGFENNFVHMMESWGKSIKKFFFILWHVLSDKGSLKASGSKEKFERESWKLVFHNESDEVCYRSFLAVVFSNLSNF